jgi:hypothetical protein
MGAAMPSTVGVFEAKWARAGPTAQQQLQLAHYRKGGQADARTFGSKRCNVTKA